MKYIFSDDAKYFFPSQEHCDEYGVLAIGGDLSPERLIFAYQHGIFPWYADYEPITWWCPDPRFVLFPQDLKVAKSMRPLFNNAAFEVTYNTCFTEVMRNCANINRKDQNGTWIIEEIIEAYTDLYEMGIAHSVEVWQKKELVGGLYGIRLGNIFFGESMFSKVANASKYGFITYVKKLIEEGIVLIDCQQETPHLASLGAKAIDRNSFLHILAENI
jgi:leucyl/phenylalanyl-tRNA---protein transferase